MAGARGKQVYFDAAEIAGEDGRIWQKDGSANKTTGVVFTQQGEAIKTPGIASLNTWAPAGRALTVLGSYPVMSIGTFHHHGMTDIVGNAGRYLFVIRGNDIIYLATNRTVPEKPSEAHRFIQVGDVLIMLNGKDQNLKWDGRKVTPLGIAPTPPSPQIAMDENNHLPESVLATAGPFGGTYTSRHFWGGRAMFGTGTAQRFRYRMSWVNDKGQESEASTSSSTIEVTAGRYTDDTHLFNLLVTGLAAEAPSDDIIGRNLYRSTDGQLWSFIKYLPGTQTDTWWDYIPIGEEAGDDILPGEGTNLPPPLALWGFPFRGRVYYGGNPQQTSTLYYSRKDGGKEAVSSTNFLDVASHDGDKLTGYCLSQDYAVVFKQRSIFMLTHDKNEDPILTPVVRGIGCVNDRTAVAFEGRTYFLSENGVYMFDGSSARPLSSELSRKVQLLPRSGLEEAFAWADSKHRRIYFSVVGGPGSANNEVWALHVDTGAISRIESMTVNCATPFNGETLVGFTPVISGGGPNNDIGVWGVRDDAGTNNFYGGRFETRWMHFDSPTSDKEFTRLELYYVQQGSHELTVDWGVDWDDRQSYTAEAIPMAASDSTLWGSGNWDNSLNAYGFANRPWDEKRVRTARVDLTAASSGKEARGRALKVGIQTAPDGGNPWRLVGMLVHYADLGNRATALYGE